MVWSFKDKDSFQFNYLFLFQIVSPYMDHIDPNNLKKYILNHF